MKFIEYILFYISVPKCIQCGERLLRTEKALCKNCKEEYDNAIQFNCAVCAKPLCECNCTHKYLDAHFIHKLVKVFRYRVDYDLPTNKLIFSLKRDNRDDVLDFLADELASAIIISVKNPETYIFTSVPRRRLAKVKYGIDHAELLSKRIAKKLGAKYRKVLISKAKHEQKKSKNTEDRLKNAKLELINDKIDLTGNIVILVDDIVTTGASMSAAATLLKASGANRIIGATLAIAYKDNWSI